MKYIRVFFITLLFLLIAAIAIAYIWFRSANIELASLDNIARENVPGSFIKLSDGITHYELSGPDTGKLVVLVHGFSVPYYIWDSTAPALIKEGFRVLRYDEFGRGYSDRPDKVYEASLYRRQLSELLAKLNIRSAYAVAGVSFGGAVITDFAINNPDLVSKIILVDPVYPGTATPPYPESFVKYMMAIYPEDRAKGQLGDLKYSERFPHWVDQYREQMKYKGFRAALASTLFHYAPQGTIKANYRALDALHKQVLLIWGKEDKTVDFRFSDSLRLLLKTEFMPVVDAAHLPQMEKTALVNEKMISFLKNAE
jgi:pimeloyl-ACP methyl ester carboxylesterase